MLLPHSSSDPSVHPHHRVSHPCPTIYVPGKCLVSQWCLSWAALCAPHTTTGTSTTALLPGAVVQSCTRSSCSPFCGGCKHPRVRFEHFNDNHRQHKISLALPFPGLCSAGVGQLGNSSSAFNSTGETAWARHLRRTPHRFTQG